MAKQEAKQSAKKADDRDFGVDQQHQTERTYTSTNTRRSDRGGAMPRSGEDEAERDSGVGGDNAGPGSSSGGDIDAGDATLGGGISQSGPDRDYPGGADDASKSTLGMGRANDRRESASSNDSTANAPAERAGESPPANEIANDAAAGEDETSG
jgi:hypothetical protein